MPEYSLSENRANYAPPRAAIPPGTSVETQNKSARAEQGSSPSPLRSAEAFENYCTQVQSRLAEHAAQRTHFLQAAFERLTRLLHTARDVEDAALYNELWQHRVAVRELLESLSHVASSSSGAPVSTAVAPTPAVAPAVAPAAPSLADNLASEKNVSNPTVPPVTSLDKTSSEHISSVSPGPAYPTIPLPSKPLPLQSQPANGHSVRDVETEDGYAQEQMPRSLRHPVRPLIDIETDAVALREQLRGWTERLPLRMENGNLNVPNCLRLRAFACRQRRLEEEAGDTEVAEVTELSKDILDIMDRAGDEEYTVALDYDVEPLPTAFQWGELAERYEETAKAEEAFEWWIANRSVLSVSDVQGLAESVAAIQQRFNRLLFRIGARDPFQQQLFDDLRVWAKEAQCYLYSLRPKVPIAELIEKALMIDEAWEQAREPLRALEERQHSVEAVVELVSVPGFGANEAKDEAHLQAALLHCKELRIPASDRRLRDALLPWASFLESDERFRELLREIHLEWERRQEIGRAEPVEEEPSGAMEELAMELQAVREVTRGKRCLLLGGTCREENRRKIEEALQLSELVWPSTKPSDPLAKFDTELRHSDIVALLTRFSRKEWKNAQDICARDGKKFVHLTTGYGVSQVVRHFYNQIAPHKSDE